MFGFSGCAKDAGTSADQTSAEKAVNEGGGAASDTKDATAGDKAAADTSAADTSSDTKPAEETK